MDAQGEVHYEVWKMGGKLERVYSEAEVGKALERVADTPRKWKRIVWFGAFSDGQRTKTMASLGLERQEKSDEEEEGWRQVVGGGVGCRGVGVRGVEVGRGSEASRGRRAG